MTADKETLISLTADVVVAYVSNNSVAPGDMPAVIAAVFGALEKPGTVAELPPEKPVGAVSVRASIRPDYLVSMIDGRHFKTLRRHLSINGYTPESYREAFGLPHDYPMVAANYAEERRALSIKLGLGHKRTASPEPKAKTSRKTLKIR